MREGYLEEDYNPITLNPVTIRKLLYNPGRLGKMIARACLLAWDEEPMKIGRAVMRELASVLGKTSPPRSSSLEAPSPS